MNQCKLFCRSIKNLCNTDSGESVVPTEYRQVAYLENTGEEYIITTLQPYTTMKTELKFSLSDSPDYTQMMLFGTRGKESVWGTNYWIQLASATQFLVGNVSSYSAINNITLLSGENSLSFMSGEIKLNDSVIGNNTTGYDKDYHSRVINLWRRPSYNKNTLIDNDSPIASAGLRIHGVKFTYNGDLVGDMYPCYRKSDNKPGMYDLVTETFLTNAGTGDFTVGPKI